MARQLLQSLGKRRSTCINFQKRRHLALGQQHLTAPEPALGDQATCLTVTAYEDLNVLKQLGEAWEELLSFCPEVTTFSTWEWLSSWWVAFGQGRKLRVLAFLNTQGRLVGLAPMSIISRRVAGGQRLSFLELMGDGSGDSDSLGFLVAPGWEEAFTRTLLRELKACKGVWDVCQLNTMPADSPVVERILALLKQAGWTAFEYRRPASAITLPASWEEYLKQLSSENRKNLTRYLRRLEKRYQTRFFRCVDAAELPRCLDALFRLHQARWEQQGGSGSFACRERRSFYFELSRALLARGWLEFWALELDGEIASAQYALRYRNSVFQLQEGNDPAHTSDRVGFLLRAHAIRHMIGEGVRKYDFLGGEPGYKADWGAKRGHYRDLHFARPYTRGAFFLFLVYSAKESKKWLRQRSPKAAWNLLHRINIALKEPQRKTSS